MISTHRCPPRNTAQHLPGQLDAGYCTYTNFVKNPLRVDLKVQKSPYQVLFLSYLTTNRHGNSLLTVGNIHSLKKCHNRNVARILNTVVTPKSKPNGSSAVFGSALRQSAKQADDIDRPHTELHSYSNRLAHRPKSGYGYRRGIAATRLLQIGRNRIKKRVLKSIVRLILEFSVTVLFHAIM